MGPQTSYKQKQTTILPHLSRPESWCYSCPQIMQSYNPNDPQTHFLKNEKKVPRFFWGCPGGKAPGWKERLLKQVNISFLTMSKPFQSCQNPSKHAKKPENQVSKSKILKNLENVRERGRAFLSSSFFRVFGWMADHGSTREGLS